MTAAMAMPGNTAETFLVHFFGTGLADDRYVVERFRARADGDIVPAPGEAPRAKGQCRVKRITATLKAVRDRTDLEIGGHLLALYGWKIEREKGIFGHGGRGAFPAWEERRWTTNSYPMSKTQAMSAITASGRAE